MESRGVDLMTEPGGEVGGRERERFRKGGRPSWVMECRVGRGMRVEVVQGRGSGVERRRAAMTLGAVRGGQWGMVSRVVPGVERRADVGRGVMRRGPAMRRMGGGGRGWLRVWAGCSRWLGVGGVSMLTGRGWVEVVMVERVGTLMGQQGMVSAVVVLGVGAVRVVAVEEVNEAAEAGLAVMRVVVCNVGMVVRGCVQRVGKYGACVHAQKGIGGGSGAPMRRCLCMGASRM